MKDKAADILGRHCPGLTPLFIDKSTIRFRDSIVEAMREYARIACEEQRKICADEAKTYDDYYRGRNTVRISKETIINAPAPTLD